MCKINEIVDKLKAINEQTNEDLLDNYFKNKWLNEEFYIDLQLVGRSFLDEEIQDAHKRYFRENHTDFYNGSNHKFDVSYIIDGIINDSDLRSWELFRDYELVGGRTLQSIANEYDITRERIRQIKKKIREKVINSDKIKAIFIDFYRYLMSQSSSKQFIGKSMFQENEIAHFGEGHDEIFVRVSLMAYVLNLNLYKTEKYYVFVNKKYDSLDQFIEYKVYNLFEEDKLYDISRFQNEVIILDVPMDYLRKWLVERNWLVIYKEYFYFKKKKLTKVDKCKFILLLLGEPSHYSDVYRLYAKVYKDRTSEHSVHALMDRGRDIGIVRTFTGFYGLIDLGEKQHISIQDIAVGIMKNEIREYDLNDMVIDIMKFTEAKRNSIVTTLFTNKTFLITKESTIILRTWNNQLELKETTGKNAFNEQGVVDGCEYIKYTINEFTKKYNRIRIPLGFTTTIKPFVSCSYKNKELLLKYDVNSRLLVGIDKFVYEMGLCQGDSFFMVFYNDAFYLYKAIDEFSKSSLSTEIVDRSVKHVDSILRNLFGR